MFGNLSDKFVFIITSATRNKVVLSYQILYNTNETNIFLPLEILKTDKREIIFDSIQNKFSYILAPKGVSLFQKLNKYSFNDNNYSSESITNKLLKPGDAASISFFEVGDFIHAIEAFPGQGSIFGRASGSYCQIRSVNQSTNSYVKNKEEEKFAIVRLPSGNKRFINIKAQATLGRVGQDSKIKPNRLKAGRMR
jgi:ribosomal protein L2